MYSSMSVVAPTALAAWSAATWMNIWYLRFLSMLLITVRAFCTEWWFTRSSMWLQREGREGGRGRGGEGGVEGGREGEGEGEGGRGREREREIKGKREKEREG